MKARLARARRVVVVPDGPLHLVPFAALTASGGRFLVEGRPFSVVSSATLLAELRKLPPRSSAGPASVVAFGDPAYPRPDGPSPADARVRAALRNGALSPLPATRREVEGIREATKGLSAFLGAEPTEERAKSVRRGARSVVASLWTVSDDSTATLMKELHRQIAAGTAKDEALRSARLSLLSAGGDLARPFLWAPFELLGDPR